MQLPGLREVGGAAFGGEGELLLEERDDPVPTDRPHLEPEVGVVAMEVGHGTLRAAGGEPG